ncbi:MAG: hypothetical protein IJJ01_04155 [Firmicutes bacterium]|nr:hypothetical protein [Bacillota bacterium]
MKKKSINTKRIINIFIAVVLAVAMSGFLGACGDKDSVEETVEITTPSEEAETEEPIYEQAVAEGDDDAEGEEAEDDEDTDEDTEDTDEDADEQDDANTSQYAKIYKDCDAKMKDATKQYVKSLNSDKFSLSKSKLYDATQDKIKELEKVYDDGKDKMVEAMLASTEDDGKEYKKYFKKMTEAYSEYSREITSVYTDAF